ncbi:MAG TPA: SCO family protein [Chitinophagaceae bacterium]|nr:SCO family protein [Chitinophagaceae bacterium]HMZ45269.1 SCO family protein [Chitinophagaceae bacterium]HNE92670.1 SCO family protein [Chitinophagaceae bacterium]HNF28846.1 SCO family protein [Chitinophagaceae bacterium]HNJ58317.1 SCO family protein [Chitinophagaceae bacterium]
MMKKKKWIFYVTFFVGLILVFWLALYLFTDTFNQSRLVNRSVVKPFTFYKEDGSLFTKADMAGKVCVVEFFFTTCPNICPEMNTNMKKVYEAFKDEPNFLILSHTCDPKRDSVPVLKKYADSMQVNTQVWAFLTGSKDSLYNMARESYGIDDPKSVVNNIEDDFLHSQFFALVDKNGNVRGQVYDGLKQDEIKQLKKDIKELLNDKGNRRGFSNNLFN